VTDAGGLVEVEER